MGAKDVKKIIITVGKPDGHKSLHIGHLAGGMIYADIYARFMRKELGTGNVLFLSGTECYGSSVEATFQATEGGHPSLREYVYQTHLRQAEVSRDYQVNFDDFFCDAHDPELHDIHSKICQMFVDALVQNGDIICKSERILVDAKGSFLNYRQVGSGFDRAQFGPEARKNYASISPDQINNGEIAGIKYVNNYFIDYRKWELQLKELIRTRYSGQEKYLKDYLNSKSECYYPFFRLTSDAEWAMDTRINGQNKKLWVWIDSLLAPLSYTIKTVGSFAEAIKWWGGSNSEVIHFIAEDNIKFYGVLENCLIASWNDANEWKINNPQLYLTPMRTLSREYTGPFPTGEMLLDAYTPEQIRYCLAAMGPHNVSFCPARLMPHSGQPDMISSRCDSLLKKMNRLLKNARQQLDTVKTPKTSSDAVKKGNSIYQQYSEHLYQMRFNRAVDVIEENIRSAIADRENAAFFAKLFLHMLYPILPEYSIRQYNLLFNEKGIYEKYILEVV